MFSMTAGLQVIHKTLFFTPRFVLDEPGSMRCLLSPVDTMRAVLKVWSPLSIRFDSVTDAKEKYSELLVLCPGKVYSDRCMPHTYSTSWVYSGLDVEWSSELVCYRSGRGITSLRTHWALQLIVCSVAIVYVHIIHVCIFSMCVHTRIIYIRTYVHTYIRIYTYVSAGIQCTVGHTP